MEKILNMTLREIIETGANIDIYYHFLKDEEEAREKIRPFESLGEIDKHKYDNETARVGVYGNDIDVAAFYTPPKEYEPEEARARLTEYERGLRDSGHKQTDFL